jgi:Golgi phosphoprotein 3
MLDKPSLYLYEEIMLLALRDKEGTIAAGTMYPYAIGGAIIAELVLHDRISVRESKRKQLVEATSAKPIGDPLLDECLSKIRSAKRRASIQTWIQRFAGIRKLHHRVATQLCRRGILRADEGSFLLIFTRKIYPEMDPRPERDLTERLRKAIFTDTGDLDARTVVLVSLANSAGFLRVAFDKKKLKERKARIERVVNGEVTGRATHEVIQAVQTAIMVAALMPAIVATSVTH